MPLEIKELKIKAVVNTQPVTTTPGSQVTIAAVQLEKWKKEVINEALARVKEYLREQNER